MKKVNRDKYDINLGKWGHETYILLNKDVLMKIQVTTTHITS
jgi:hypothetical protein